MGADLEIVRGKTVSPDACNDTGIKVYFFLAKHIFLNYDGAS